MTLTDRRDMLHNGSRASTVNVETENVDRASLLTIDEVAGELRISPRTVKRLIQTGALPAIKLSERVIRIRRTDLDALIITLRSIP